MTTPERLEELADFAEQSGNKPWLAEIAAYLRNQAALLRELQAPPEATEAVYNPFTREPPHCPSCDCGIPHEPLTAHPLYPLAQLGLWCLDYSREDVTDVDCGSLQDRAIEMGLLKGVPVTKPCNEDGYCNCAEYGDFPQDCLRKTDAAKALDSLTTGEGRG